MYRCIDRTRYTSRQRGIQCWPSHGGGVCTRRPNYDGQPIKQHIYWHEDLSGMFSV